MRYALVFLFPLLFSVFAFASPMKPNPKTGPKSAECGLAVSVQARGAPMRVTAKKFPAGNLNPPQVIYRGTLSGTQVRFLSNDALVLIAFDHWVHRYSLDGLNGAWNGLTETTQLALPTGDKTEIESLVKSPSPTEFGVLFRQNKGRSVFVFDPMPLDPPLLDEFSVPGVPSIYGNRQDNGPELVFGGVSKVEVWDLITKSITQTFTTETSKDGKAPNRVESVAISSRHVASVSNHHVVRVWDRSTSKMVILSEVPHCGQVLLDETGRLYLGLYGGDVEIWDIASGELRQSIVNRRGSQQTIPRLVLSPDGTLIALQQANERVDIYRTSDLALIASLPHNQYRSLVQFSPDAKWVTTSTKGGEIQIWRLRK